MLTEKIISQFYLDVNQLKLKRPVSAISKETGFSKGTVSMYLNKKATPSENFIKAFYSKFEQSLNNVPHGKTDLALHENDPGYGKASYQDKYIALLEKENEQKNKLIELSLTELLMGQRVSQAHLKTLLQVTVTETAVMQGKDPVAALKKANTTVAANYQETLPKGNG